MNFNPNDIHDFDIVMNKLIENSEEGILIGINMYDTPKEYNLKIIEVYLEKHPNISLSFDRYHDLTKEHELYFNVK